MKKISLLCVILFFSLGLNAQIVTIPDSAFKTLLATTNCVDTNNDDVADVDADTNNDGEVQVSEAIVITNLIIKDNNEIVNLEGILSFSNLTSLSINSIYNIETLDLSTLISLKNLKLINIYGLITLNINGLTNLEFLEFSNNYHITIFNYTGLNSLKNIIFKYTGFTFINFNEILNLENFAIQNNGIQNLNLTSLINLKTLNCNLNYSEILNVSGLTNLETIECDNSSLYEILAINTSSLKTLKCNGNYTLTNIILSGASSLQYLDCSLNYNLSNLNLIGLSELEYLDCSLNPNLTNLNLTGLSELQYLDCNTNNISSLNTTGLSNLTHLDCKFNNISLLEANNLPNLTFLDCADNIIQTLNLNNTSNLTTLYCSNNILNSLDLSTQINLTFLECESNHITTLDVSNSPNLIDIYCSENDLTSLNIANLTDLKKLGCSYNQLTNLDFSNTPKLRFLGLNGNLFSTLDFSSFITDSPTDYIFYSLSNNPNLTYINAKNNVNPLTFSAVNCINLHYVCANESIIEYISSRIELSGLTNVEVNAYCNFIPVGNFNTITGTLTIDYNNDGCDSNDNVFPDLKIENTNGILNEATFTNTSGNYTFYPQSGNYTISPIINNPYFTVSPAFATINFPLANSSTQNQNFCITQNGIHNDLEIVIIPIGNARPGFDSDYQVIYKNKGNQTLSGTINFTFNDLKSDFVSATPSVTIYTFGSLIWNYIDLLPFESRTIEIKLNTNTPNENQPVNINDILSFNAIGNPITDDETAADNSFSLTQIVVASYDPNDKTCLEGNTITPEKVGDYLHYLIRFQNSGTAAAENIVVKDVIDTTKFDISSLQLTSASHPYETKVTGDKIEFIFENIQLPAEIDNEPESHGFVAFKIKTKSDLVLGNSVSNKADIYFDYNFPIVTEPAVTTISVLGVNEFENKLVSVFPNPVSDVLNITSKGIIKSVQIYDVQGRLTDAFLKDEEKTTINLSNKKTGAYFVKIFTDKGVKVEKVVKK